MSRKQESNPPTAVGHRAAASLETGKVGLGELSKQAVSGGEVLNYNTVGWEIVTQYPLTVPGLSMGNQQQLSSFSR